MGNSVKSLALAATFTGSIRGSPTSLHVQAAHPNGNFLGVGAVRPTPALKDGQLIEHQLLTLTLSCDHRILYGADAAQFLAAIRAALETPLRLLL